MFAVRPGIAVLQYVPSSHIRHRDERSVKAMPIDADHAQQLGLADLCEPH